MIKGLFAFGLAEAAFPGIRFWSPGAEIAAWPASCLTGLDPNKPEMHKKSAISQDNLDFLQQQPLQL
jgi:hypothetical protein